MPLSKQGRKSNGRFGSPEPGVSRREKHVISSDEEDDPFPKKGKGASCSKMSKLGKISKKVPSASKMGGLHTPCHNKPAELFRKDLISAMKLPDTEILYESEYVVISDPWRQEWEKGVQVPVNEEEMMEVIISKLEKEKPKEEFKLPVRKFLHECTDETYEQGKHELTGMQELAEQIVRYDLDDQDVQWLELVNEDREDMGLQLINEWNLERMIEELENQCYVKTNAVKKTEEGLGIEYDEDVACDVCRLLESEDTNEMVFCDGCDICVHQACYGIQTIPEGTWLCRICALGIKPMCLLCPKRGGAMKPTKSGTKWTHVSCALWIPEVSIGCPEKMEPITKISNIPTSRWALVCCLCKERVGACIQCSVKQCKTAFHVTCGFAHNLDMRTIVDDSDDVDGIHLRAYCPKHSKNRTASESDSPKKEESQEDEENDISEAEMAKKRMEKLNQLEEEFYTLVDLGEVARKFYIPEEAVDIVSEYWKLKRKANNNKPLITPKMEEEDQMQRQQKDSLTARMKMFVHLRQDLERARNLCYMISKREKTKRQLFNSVEAVFHSQLQVLTDPDQSLSARDAEHVRQLTRFNSIYSYHSQKLTLGSKPPRENLFTLENLKTPKDDEEEKAKAEKVLKKKPVLKSKRGESKSAGDSKTKLKKETAKPEKTVKSSAHKEDEDKTDLGPDLGLIGTYSKEAKLSVENESSDNEEVSSKSRLGKVSFKEIQESTKEEEEDTKAASVEHGSPSKKHVIPPDLQQKLSSILQSQSIVQKQKDKSDSLSESFVVDVENIDGETVSPELKIESAPVEERMNLFDQFSTDQELAATAKPPLSSESKKETVLTPDKSASTENCAEVDNDTALINQSEEDSQERWPRHSSHKKAKRRKRSRSSHKHRHPHRSPLLDSRDCSHLSVSPIIIKTEGDTIVSKQGNNSACESTYTDTRESDTLQELDDSLNSDFQTPPSFSKSNKSSKKKRSRRDRRRDSLQNASLSKTSRHCHQTDSPERNSDSDQIEVNEHVICLEDLPSPSKEGDGQPQNEEKLHSKLRLKKQLSPVKGVISYKVVKDEDVKSSPDKDIKKKTKKIADDDSRTKSINYETEDKHINVLEDNMSTKNTEEFKTVPDLASDEKDDYEGKVMIEVKEEKKPKWREGNLRKRHVKQDDSSVVSEVKERSEEEEEKKSKWGDANLRKRHAKQDDMSFVSEVKEGSVNSEDKSAQRSRASSTPEPKKRTRHRHPYEELSLLSPERIDDSSDKNYHPTGISPKVSPIDKSLRPRRLRARRQLHPDETDGDDDNEGEELSNGKSDEDAEKSIVGRDKGSHSANKRKDAPNSSRSNGLTRKVIKLKSPLPDKPEINKLLMDPNTLIVKNSLRKKIGERLASSLKGRSRWRTICTNQPTLDKFVKRTNSCENVFSKPDIVCDPNAKRLCLPLARADLSPLSVNKSSVVNSSQRETDSLGVSNTVLPVSPVKSPSIPTNVIFGAHSSPRGSLNTYRIPRRSQNSSVPGRLKNHNSPLDDIKASCELTSTTSSNTDSVFGGAEKLQRPGLRRQLSFENIGSHQGENPVSLQRSLDLSEVVSEPFKCDTSKLSEDHLDGTQSYRSPSPVSSITSVASSRLEKLQAGKGDYDDDDEEENTPSKRVTRSQLMEDGISPSTKLRNREVIVKPPKLTLS